MAFARSCLHEGTFLKNETCGALRDAACASKMIEEEKGMSGGKQREGELAGDLGAIAHALNSKLFQL